MKKRILALALAGTTAFSVFGAAISANAATSTDVDLEVDAYKSYEPVASTITATQTVTNAKTTFYWNVTSGKNGPVGGDGSLDSLNAYLKTNESVSSNYLKVTYVRDGYYVDADCKYIIGNAATTGVAEDINAHLDLLGITKTADNKYLVDSNAEPAYDTLAEAVAKATKTVPTDTEKVYHVYNGTEDSYKSNAKYKYTEKAYNEALTNGTLMSADAFTSKYTYSITTPGSTSGNDVSVSGGDYTNWTFNSDMTGDVAVTPFKTKTEIKYDKNGNPYLNVTKTETNTVYAYDFIYNNPEVTASASSIASAWANKDVATLAGLLAGDAKGNELTAERNGGVAGRGIRYDVVSEWEAFLSELTILNDSIYGTITDKDEFKDMYLDRFYSDPVYNKYSGFIEDYKDIDLYNINGLLDDIWELRTAKVYGTAGSDNYSKGYYYANTSEMVYLMQQYDKYIGNYIDQEEVSTDEWGDLLVDLLNATTSDNFKSALDYNRYVAEVSRLTANYQNALTAAQVTAAEKAMYNLLVNNYSYGNYMFYTSGVEKTALAETMEGLYFNVGTIPTQYSVNPSTAAKVSSDVDYTNYNYLVAALNNKPVYGTNDQSLSFTNTLTAGYYSLYPMADYLDYTGYTNAVYAGNVSEPTYASAKATDEYEWFWNVYQLAANMNKYNKFQGPVDAVNDALNAAVAELAVLTTPSNVETGALADAIEKYEGKIDTDYNEGYYAKYTQANDYAENVAEGKWQTRIAAMITGVAGEALTYQGTQVTITKNDMKTVETAIKNGKTALEAIKADANYNAAQVTALNKAIDNAQYLVDLYEGTYSKNKDYQSVNKVYTYLTGDKDQMVKSDLTAAIEAIDAAINYSEIVMGWSQNDAGKWQYGTEEGYLSNGWNKIGKTWFYFNADGTAKQSEWFQENGTWYWFNSNCGAATGWAKVDGEWYFFKGNNAMKTGWEKVDGNWYYMASSGKMVTGWCEVNGKWYYFSKESNSLGQMLYSTTVDGYKLGADGAWIK